MAFRLLAVSIILTCSFVAIEEASAADLKVAPNACNPCKVTFNVNSTADAVDANPGDGVCATSAHVCSLRAAVMEGNAMPWNFMVQINVPAGAYTLSILGAGESQSAKGDLNIRRAMTISGAGSSATIIQGSATNAVAATDGILEISGVAAFSVTISDLELRYGHKPGVFVGGNALESTMDVTLNRCIVAGNAASKFAIGAFYQPDPFRMPTVTLNSCIVTGNVGGSIMLETANLVAVDTTINANTGSHYTGILAFHGSTVNLTKCTISNNTATINGASIVIGLDDTDMSSATLTNCTVTGNTAGYDASITSQGVKTAITLLNVTSVNNSSGMGGTGTITVKDSVLADNSSNCNGTFSSLGHNLSSDLTCMSYLIAAGDMNGVDPKLGPLALNAPGTTATRALLAGSPAIDGGSGCAGTDQRGIARPQGAACDIGAFELVGAARFDSSGDRKGDLFWRNSVSGDNSMWFMDGPAIAFSISELTVADPNFKVVGIGDFDGDGKNDILWRNSSTGANIVWFMNGGSIASSSVLQTVGDTNWVVGGVGDFQGDGKADIFWHHLVSGSNAMWLMNGATVAVSATVPAVAGTSWVVAGVGDFQGDGKDDIIWRNAVTGANVVWLMDGTSVAVSGVLQPVPDPAWAIVGVGDFDGDGKSDLLWRNATLGANEIWFMNGPAVGLTAMLQSVPGADWKVARVADFQGDGKADIMWRNSTSGANSQWLMNGPNIALSSSLPSVLDTNFHVVP